MAAPRPNHNLDYNASMASYLRGSMRHALLSVEDEVRYIRAWQEKKDQRALDTLIRAHGRLVLASVNKFRNYGLSMSDLVQEGNLGLMLAVERFDLSREVRFSTYAAWWIKSCAQDFILKNWSIVRMGSTSSQKSLFFNLRRLRAQIEEATGGDLTYAGQQDIAATLGVAVADVVTMTQRLSGADSSLSSTLGEDSEDTAQDFLKDERPNPEEVMMTRFDNGKRLIELRRALDVLSPREKDIIITRRLQDDGESSTLEALGARLGVSKERVRQLETRALSKMRVVLNEANARAEASLF
ncbi:MAG: RNA polymerase factor sigma-32 [Alphaproteobacteria bacterium]|jgi:RNA polymerase sigma-32 factor|nr:RNA polymerase factor sigma-32 [Alphaproteobacteria bacterium]